MDESEMDVIARHVRHVTQIIDNDRHTLALYYLAAEEDDKAMEITYTRSK